MSVFPIKMFGIPIEFTSDKTIAPTIVLNGMVLLNSSDEPYPTIAAGKYDWCIFYIYFTQLLRQWIFNACNNNAGVTVKPSSIDDIEVFARLNQSSIPNELRLTITIEITSGEVSGNPIEITSMSISNSGANGKILTELGLAFETDTDGNNNTIVNGLVTYGPLFQTKYIYGYDKSEIDSFNTPIHPMVRSIPSANKTVYRTRIGREYQERTYQFINGAFESMGTPKLIGKAKSIEPVSRDRLEFREVDLTTTPDTTNPYFLENELYVGSYIKCGDIILRSADTNTSPPYILFYEKVDSNIDIDEGESVESISEFHAMIMNALDSDLIIYESLDRDESTSFVGESYAIANDKELRLLFERENNLEFFYNVSVRLYRIDNPGYAVIGS